MRLAVFVTPHGFGHAARAAAVLAALREELPALEATLFTSVPRWFFSESLDFSFDYRELACDVGFMQRSAVEEDLGATIGRLAELWAEAADFLLKDLVSQLVASRAEAVLCDIAPLGLVAAQEAGIPSILVESFTWDWIYEGVLEREPRFAPWIRRLREAFELATLRIQTEPVCSPAPGATRVGPIARRPRTPRRAVRERLGIGCGRSMVLVSLGGIESRIAHLERLELPGVDFVVPGGVAAGQAEARRKGLVLLPHHTPIFHPDLVCAADAVVGKLGYSTVAEAVAAGTCYAYLQRPGFRESAVLASYVEQRLPALELEPAEFASGLWTRRLPELLARPRPEPSPADGAGRAARAIQEARILNG